MISLVFLLEDRSMEALLEGLLPRIFPSDVFWELSPHEGKADLDKSIPRKLKAWRDPKACFVVLRDQDSADCRVLKQRLSELCHQAGRPETLVRIACRELESWYLADLAAVDRAFGSSVASQQVAKKFRNPDLLGSPSRELALLVPSFGKVNGAKDLGTELALENARSPSFAHFLRGLQRLVEAQSTRGATTEAGEEGTPPPTDPPETDLPGVASSKI